MSKTNKMRRRAKTSSLSIFSDSVLLQPLGKLRSFAPSSLCSMVGKANAADQLVLALSLAYNDLKDIMFWQGINEELSPPPPIRGSVSKAFGQSAGIDGHLHRITCGWLVEVVDLLRHNHQALANAHLKAALGRLTEGDKLAWANLLSLSQAGKARQKFSQNSALAQLNTYLVHVRSHGGFHYYQTKPFSDGFRAHFSGSTLEESKAYIADGKNFEESRFFYADAAASGASRVFTNGLSIDPSKYIPTFVRASHIAIRAIVFSYFAEKKVVLNQEE